jgi:hypothetical protein
MSVAIFGWKEIYDDRVVTSMFEKYNMDVFTEEEMCRGHIIYGKKYKLSEITGKLQLCLEDIENVKKAHFIYCEKYNVYDSHHYEQNIVELHEHIYGEITTIEDVYAIYFEDP